MKNVLFLRAPEEAGPDRYETALEGRGYVPLSVPVLETVLVHVDTLRDKILRGSDELSGVILTSKRAVEAWCEALGSIAEATPVDWRTVPFYAVGEATATVALRIQEAFPSMGHLAPADVRGGAEAGTAERLATFILAERCAGRRMLYLTGDKNRETLPGILTAGGVVLEALDVYRTTGSSTFRADLEAALHTAPMDAGVWGWVVYFAPSAAAFVTPVLREVFPGGDALKVAAIGPTTAAFLADTLQVRVDVVSPKPTPEALGSAIAAFDDALEWNIDVT